MVHPYHFKILPENSLASAPKVAGCCKFLFKAPKSHISFTILRSENRRGWYYAGLFIYGLMSGKSPSLSIYLHSTPFYLCLKTDLSCLHHCELSKSRPSSTQKPLSLTKKKSAAVTNSSYLLSGLCANNKLVLLTSVAGFRILPPNYS